MHWWSAMELVKCWGDSSRTSLDFQVKFTGGPTQTILWLRPVLLMFLNNKRPFIWFRCLRQTNSGSIADLPHVRTQWCLADCLTKKCANPQNHFDAVRQGVLKEVDAHLPVSSLLEHKAYIRSWLLTVCSHVDFRHDVFLLGDTLRDSGLLLNLCLRLKKDSQYDDEERLRSPPGGYAQRKSEVVSFDEKRKPATLPKENHMAFSEGHRYETAWFQAQGRLKKKRNRDMHILMGPDNMSGFARKKMFMDVISWILYWGSEHRKFDMAIKWLAEFLKYPCGFITQDEEDWFDEQCNS